MDDHNEGHKSVRSVDEGRIHIASDDYLRSDEEEFERRKAKKSRNNSREGWPENDDRFLTDDDPFLDPGFQDRL
ncbi:hypothetical protein DCC39_15265 [Pueribacillus theae]|uniref:Uncharacterized protein n=1 Tax=Pueribacillus theae TaxID=2171751 RepID=A0A2U1JT63_9BACI|nr:hypothetical protein [Pueribacillus theae]PWA08144.1 hypothetical protein DCC39_15265 [Pueribacillus theae]